MAVLPMKCRRYLSGRGMAFRELQEGGQQAVILPALTLPPGHFDAMAADWPAAGLVDTWIRFSPDWRPWNGTKDIQPRVQA
jgi:hypothetical protein